MAAEKRDTIGERFGTLEITGRVGIRRVITLCDCGQDSEHLYQHLRKGKVKQCSCHKAWMGALGVPVGVWRNGRKFKCVECREWQPLYYESRAEGVCKACG